jgi:protein-tyrosine phosphatase
LDELEQRSIAGHVVVELLPDTPVPFLATVTERLAERGLRPVVAHPELARSVERHPEALDDVRAAGGLVQVLAAGVVGYWGERVASVAWELIESGRADLLGSDAHGQRRPATYFARAMTAVAERFGDSFSRDLTEKGPSQLLDGAGVNSWG